MTRDNQSANDLSAQQAGNLRVYGRLLRYIRPHLGMFALNILGFMLFASTQPMLAKLSEFLIDTLAEKEPAENAEEASRLPILDIDFSWFTDLMPTVQDNLMMIPVFVVIIYLLRGIGLFVGNYAIAAVAENIVHKLRTEVFDTLTNLPATYFDQHNSGNLISKITYNVAQVTIAATEALKITIREGFIVIAVMIYLFVVNWQLTMIFVVISPVIGALVAIAGRRLRRISGRVQTAMGAITTICSEMIGGYRVMRTFGGEEYERKRFRKVSDYTRRQNLKMVLTQNLAASVNQFIVAIALGALMFIALIMSATGSAGELVGYMVAVGFLPKSLKQLSDIYGKIQKGLVAAHSVFEQIDEPPETDTGNYSPERIAGRVECRNLSFRYPAADEHALRDIDLTVEPGETVALVGKSGSGKSTLVSLIPRYYDFEAGQILLDGRSLKDYTLRSLRRQIALVTQDVVLFNDTVANNIAYGDLAGKGEAAIRQAADNANATEFIERLPDGFNTEIGEDGVRLSGGQRQRLSIARALLKDAPILILDEATSALDTESERLIQSALENVMRNRTTFIIAHRLSTIENASKIVVMSAGRIVEIGTHQELLAKGGHYAKLRAMQFKDDVLAKTIHPWK